ncbi:MAG: RNA pseudouridine synthase [Clostridiales Family XIII bacterium]|jgi:23S rRNA pseudouridine1911/1915/1917 synthase|nr:RNA pseudouridine synthase [Clostridiales Family XIII bacterium]
MNSRDGELFIETGERSEYDVEFADGDAGKRIDAAIAEYLPQMSRSRAQYLIEEGAVTLEGREAPLQKSYRVKPGDAVHLSDPVRIPLKVKPENIHITIVYEDDDVIVIDKPKGMVVHPSPGHETGTLVNALLYLAHRSGRGLPVINGEVRPGIVHRIDKNTSGLIVAAKTDAAHRGLSRQFAEHSITREYAAIAVGPFKGDEGVIDLPVGRDPADRKKQKALGPDGAAAYPNSRLPFGQAGSLAAPEPPPGFRRAVTHWRVSERIGGYTVLTLRLETGRTHQIRVHLARVGRPVLGDDLYGPARTAASNRKRGESQYLHARSLGFVHPRSGEYVEFTSGLPEYFERKLAELRKR